MRRRDPRLSHGALQASSYPARTETGFPPRPNPGKPVSVEPAGVPVVRACDAGSVGQGGDHSFVSRSRVHPAPLQRPCRSQLLSVMEVPPMHRIARMLALLVFAVAFSAAVTSAQTIPTSGSDAVQLADGSQLWMIQLSTPPTADGGTESALLAEQASFRTSASRAHVPYSERSAFHALWNGLSIAVKPEYLQT